MSARLPPDAAKAHAERLAANLRANLQRRKAQARAVEADAAQVRPSDLRDGGDAADTAPDGFPPSRE